MKRHIAEAICVSHAHRLIDAARRMDVPTMHLSANDDQYAYVVTYARIPLAPREDMDPTIVQLFNGQEGGGNDKGA